MLSKDMAVVALSLTTWLLVLRVPWWMCMSTTWYSESCGGCGCLQRGTQSSVVGECLQRGTQSSVVDVHVFRVLWWMCVSTAWYSEFCGGCVCLQRGTQELCGGCVCLQRGTHSPVVDVNVYSVVLKSYVVDV